MMPLFWMLLVVLVAVAVAWDVHRMWNKK